MSIRSRGRSVVITSSVEPEDTATPTHPFTPPRQRRSLCLNAHELSTSLPNSPMLRRRKTLALPNIPKQMTMPVRSRGRIAMPDASTPTHSFTPPPQRRSLCLNDHDLSTSLPNSPMPRRRKTLALPNIPQQVRSQLLSHSPVTTPTYAIRPHTPSGITSQSFPIPPPIPTLSELAKMSPDYFPVQVELLNGFDSEVSQLQIFNQEKLRLNIHFVERTEVVKIIDAKGRMYFLPVNSPVKFGMLYESGMQASQQSTSHKTLKRVSDILSLSSLPKVISPQTNVVKKRDTYAEKGDVLIVKGTSKQSLKCYSLSKRTYLELEQACKGNFTTDAAMTKLYLSDIVNHVVDVFPCTAKIFLHEKIQSSVAEMQSGSDVTIYEKTIVSSLIATTVNRDSTACLMLPVNESVCTLSAHMVSTLSLEAAQQLLDTTQRLKTSFDLADFTLMRDTGDDDAFDLQNQLFKEVLSCSETDFDPYVIMFPASTGIPFASPTPTGDPFASPAYTGAPFASPKSLPTESSLFEPDENSLYVEITRSLKMGPAQLTSPQQESASEDNGAEMSTPHETQLPFKERNREFLGSMTTVQVLSLLDSMGFPEYKPTFLAEKVAGDILLQCTDDILQDELRVEKQLHRIRLMKVIDGSHSAQDIMSKSDS